MARAKRKTGGARRWAQCALEKNAGTAPGKLQLEPNARRETSWGSFLNASARAAGTATYSFPNRVVFLGMVSQKLQVHTYIM